MYVCSSQCKFIIYSLVKNFHIVTLACFKVNKFVVGQSVPMKLLWHFGFELIKKKKKKKLLLTGQGQLCYNGLRFINFNTAIELKSIWNAVL